MRRAAVGTTFIFLFIALGVWRFVSANRMLSEDTPTLPASANAPFPPPLDGGEDDAAAQELLDKWKNAIAAILDGGASTVEFAARPRLSDGGEPPLSLDTEIVEPSEKEVRERTAGKSVPCTDGDLRLEASAARPVDVVVSFEVNALSPLIGTDPNLWLREMEQALATTAVDARLLVVAPADKLKIASKAAWSPGPHSELISVGRRSEPLDQLSTTGPSPWLAKLRPGADTHLILVANADGYKSKIEAFVTTLTQQAHGRLGTEAAPAFRFHTVLGFSPGQPSDVLEANEPVATRTCGAGIFHTGDDYQRLAIRTQGLRGSLCKHEGYMGFTQHWVATLKKPRGCVIALPAGTVATGVHADNQPLIPVAPGGWDDQNGERAYITGPGQITLSPKTCAATSTAAIAVRYQCAR